MELLTKMDYKILSFQITTKYCAAKSETLDKIGRHINTFTIVWMVLL